MMPSILIIISFSKNMKKALVSGLYYSISIILKNPEVGEDMEWGVWGIKSIWKFQGSIKQEVALPGVFK